MHAAKLERSPRLQRVYDVLIDGREHTTRDLMYQANVCAVSTIVGELRRNGLTISCRQTMSATGDMIWLYKLEQLL